MDTMRERFAHVTAELLDGDERVAVVLADIGSGRLADTGATTRHPERVVNVGIREQAMVGVAAGMALEGFLPIVHSYAPFLVERPYEQIKLDFAHQGVGGVFVSIGGSYDAAGEGRTHQAPEDVSLMSTIPGMAVHVPGHPDEAETALRRAISDGGLHYIRLSEARNADPHAGRDRMAVVRHTNPGAPVVVAVGPTLDRVVTATARVGATVLYTSRVRPLDATVLRSFATRDVILVEPTLEGTSAAAVSAALRDRPHRLLAIGVPLAEHRHYGTSDDHQRAHGLDAAGIRTRVEDFLVG